jgi:hypothetical protein
VRAQGLSFYPERFAPAELPAVPILALHCVILHWLAEALRLGLAALPATAL